MLLIVTPSLGISRFLDETIKSVRSVTIPHRHVIACPSHRVAALQERFPDSIVVPDQGPVGGMYGAIRAGVEAQAQWDWLTYINDDDYLLPGFQFMAESHFAQENPNAIAYGDVVYVDPANRLLCEMPIESNPRFFVPLLYVGISPFGQQGTVISHSLYQSIGGFDTSYRYCGDVELVIKAHKEQCRLQYYPLRVGAFRVLNPGQLSTNAAAFDPERLRILHTWFPKRSTTWLLIWSRLRFRFRNLPRYLERIRNVGWKTSKHFMTGGGNA